MNHESHITPQILIFLGSSTSNKPSDKRGSHTNQTPKRRARNRGLQPLIGGPHQLGQHGRRHWRNAVRVPSEVIPSLSEVALNYSST